MGWSFFSKNNREPKPGVEPPKEFVVPNPDAKKILVVDDNPVILKAMTLMLTAKGYSVLTTESAEETISLLGRQKVDLILLDLEFPPDPASVLTDGIMALDWARLYGTARNIPVFIISSLDPKQYVKRAEAAGITTCFRKPVDDQELLAAIRTELGELPA